MFIDKDFKFNNQQINNMKIAIIGTGTVGQALASKLLAVGHEIFMGTRNIEEKAASTEKDMYGNPSFKEWYQSNSGVKLQTFGQAAVSGEIIINATRGEKTIDALKLAGNENLENKILIDISNPLDFSKGMPPSFLPGLSNTNSLGEEIQKTFPGTIVVKTLNTMWSGLMVNPGLIGGGDHINFIAGNDPAAKVKVINLLTQLGWDNLNILDLGDLTAARGMEGYLLLWVKIMSISQSPAFNLKIVM
jgi:8-hydroxy-5-deazaflavin:NADPH oxidoreductase